MSIHKISLAERRLAAVLAALIAALLPCVAQRSASVTLYDDYFHSASLTVERHAEGDSAAYTLAVTYDEGNIRVFEGSELTFVLRDRTTVTLATDRRTTRADVVTRRFPDRTVRLLTCHYPITAEQLYLLCTTETRRIDITTSQAQLRRYTRSLPLRLAHAMRSLKDARRGRN